MRFYSDGCASKWDAIRWRGNGIKEFPTKGILFADITTPLEDVRPSATCSRATSVLSQPLASPLVASPLWRLRHGFWRRRHSPVGVTEIIEKPEVLKNFSEALARVPSRARAQDAT